MSELPAGVDAQAIATFFRAIDHMLSGAVSSPFCRMFSLEFAVM
jgi:hypothetical protein